MALKKRGSGEQIRPGDMRHQVIIKRGTSTDDGHGGRSASWAEVGRAWANLKPVSVNRALSYGLTLTNKAYEIDMVYENSKYTIDEDAILEVKATGQTLYIQSVLDVDMRNYRYTIFATEKK